MFLFEINGLFIVCGMLLVIHTSPFEKQNVFMNHWSSELVSERNQNELHEETQGGVGRDYQVEETRTSPPGGLAEEYLIPGQIEDYLG